MKRVVKGKAKALKKRAKNKYETLPSGKIKYYGKIFDGFNKPKKSDKPGKKMMVLAKEKDAIKIIHFGATGYGHNYSVAARKSFRARHKCDTAKDKLTARYWACKHLWAGPKGDTAASPKTRKAKV